MRKSLLFDCKCSLKFVLEMALKYDCSAYKTDDINVCVRRVSLAKYLFFLNTRYNDAIKICKEKVKNNFIIVNIMTWGGSITYLCNTNIVTMKEIFEYFTHWYEECLVRKPFFQKM